MTGKEAEAELGGSSSVYMRELHICNLSFFTIEYIVDGFK